MNETTKEPIEEQVRRLEEVLDRQQAGAQRRTRTLMIMCVAIALLATFSLLSSWNAVRDEWTEDAFAAGLAREAERLSPMAVAELMILGENLLPVYAKASQDEFAARGIEIERRLADELDAFMVELDRDTRRRLFDTRDAIREGAVALLVEMFPEMEDPDARTELVVGFTAAADHALQEGIDDFITRYTQNIDEFNDALAGFDMVGADYSSAELKKRLVHLWLQALDAEVMSL